MERGERATLLPESHGPKVQEDDSLQVPLLKHKKRGGSKAPAVILLFECLESTAFNGISTNLVVYLETVLHGTNLASASNVATWFGTSYLTPVFGAIIADSFWGNYNTILVSLVVYLLGMMLVTFSAFVPTTTAALVKVPAEAGHLYEVSDKIDSPQPRIAHTSDFKFLDKAAIVTESDMEERPEAATSWKLCTVTQVEELKILLRLLPVWITSVIVSSAFSQMNTTFVQQGSAMEMTILSMPVPAASLASLALEFFFGEAPDTMKSMCTSLALLTIALGSYMSSFIYAIVEAFTATGDSPGWISDDLNKGHLDYFFWAMAAMCTLNFVVYSGIVKNYRLKTRGLKIKGFFIYFQPLEDYSGRTSGARRLQPQQQPSNRRATGPEGGDPIDVATMATVHWNWMALESHSWYPCDGTYWWPCCNSGGQGHDGGGRQYL
uniref:Peptide transporter PTR2 n=1 Tax=Aegilops tauschii TaxID=37682 RepID=M8CQ90_AEGTA